MIVNTHRIVYRTWDELESDRKREILAIPIIAFALISFLSLISFSAQDLVTYVGTENQPIQNWIGKPGAILANAIIFVFGAAGYALPALLLLWGIDRLRNSNRSFARKARIAGCVVLLFSTASLLGLITESMNPLVSDEHLCRVSGVIGFLTIRKLLTMGPAGAYIINLSIIALAILLCTPFLFREFFDYIKTWIFVSRDNDEEVSEEGGADEHNSDGIYLRPLREEEFKDPLPKIYADEYDSDVSGLPPLFSSEDIDALDQAMEESSLPVLDPKLAAKEKELLIITQEEEFLIDEIDSGVNLIETPTNDSYHLPPLSLMEKPVSTRPEVERDEIIYNSQMLEQTLKDFNISAKVTEVNYGPTITCYELEPAPGIKISRIENLANDITRALKAENVRIVAPIPGKGTVGVEVPNRTRADVLMREIIACDSYQKKQSKLKIGLGKSISGEPFVFDLTKAPHLLVAGATGSGKSVCINTIITSLLYNAAPHEVKLLMVDPKQVELALYRDIPHLLSPVVTDPQKAGAALRWAVEEMETRYRYLKKCGVRNINEYNKKRVAQQSGSISETETSKLLPGFLPYIVVIIDELADLMMVARADVEAAIARLAAMARAVGIHLVLATQRPSVDVLTGVIKNNFPSRIAFQVSSSTDSRTILDMKGAESLMGRGDMLFHPGGAGKPVRLQGSFISTEEVEDICDFVKDQQEVEYVQEEFVPLADSSPNGMDGDDRDDLYDDALQVVLENDAASTSLLQRRLKIGYGRAARLLDLMEENGIVGPPRGSKPREVVLNKTL
jgi:DNA segregation ATPase FtsK/SpoIIIE, S-DNA-T family